MFAFTSSNAYSLVAYVLFSFCFQNKSLYKIPTFHVHAYVNRRYSTKTSIRQYKCLSQPDIITTI